MKLKLPEKSRSIPKARRVSPSPGAVVNDEEAIEARLFLMLREKMLSKLKAIGHIDRTISCTIQLVQGFREMIVTCSESNENDDLKYVQI